MYTLTINGESIDVFLDSNTTINWSVQDFETAVVSKAHKTGRIVIPATKHNNDVLGRLQELNTDGFSRATATIEGNGISFHGRVIVYPAKYDGSRWTYELQIISGNGDWVKDLEALTLQDLDLSDMLHTLNKTNIVASHSGQLGYIYDLCDRGTFMDSDKVTMMDRFPAVQIARLIKQVFKDQGIKVISNTLNSTAFTDKYLLFTRSDNVQTNQNYKRDWFFVRQAQLSAISQFFTQSTPTQIRFFNGNTTENGQIIYSEVIRNDKDYFNTTASTYTVPADMVGAMRFRVISHFMIRRGLNNEQTDTFFSTNAGVPSTATAKTRILKNNVEIASKTTTLTNAQSWGTIYSHTVETTYATVAAGDVFKAEMVVSGYVTNYETINPRITFTYIESSSLGRGIFRNMVSPWYGEGETIYIENTLPENYLQIDFIRLMTQVFDLLYAYNAEERKLYIETRSRFYTDNAQDWGSIVDISKGIEIEHTIQPEHNTNRYFLQVDSEDKNQYEIRENKVETEASTNVFSLEGVKDTEYAISDTITDICPRIGLLSNKIPVLWESAYQNIDGEEVFPPFRTKYGMRIVTFAGMQGITAGQFYVFESTLYTTYPKFEPFSVTDLLEWHTVRLKMLEYSKRLRCTANVSGRLLNLVNNCVYGLDIRTPITIQLPNIAEGTFIIEAIEGFTLERKQGVKLRLIELQGRTGVVTAGLPGEPPALELVLNADSDTLAYNDENDIIFAGETELTISET